MDAAGAVDSQTMTDYFGDEFLKSLDEDAETEVASPPGNRGRKPNGLDNEWRELELIRFADIQPRLDGRPLVKGFLEREQISLWVGETGCGKTFLLLDLSLHLAAGLDWFGRKVEQGFVVYVAAEAGRSIVNRVAAFKVAHGFNGRDIPFVAVTSPVDLCHAAGGDVDRLIDAINEAAQGSPPVLVVIDTVSRALSGGNENAPDDMGAFVHSLDRLRDELHCHPAAVHHFGKETSKGSRGHSLLRCGIDTEVEIIRDPAKGSPQPPSPSNATARRAARSPSCCVRSISARTRMAIRSHHASSIRLRARCRNPNPSRSCRRRRRERSICSRMRSILAARSRRRAITFLRT
jgi:hypothetical protein